MSNRWLSFVLFSALSCTGALAQKQPAAQNDRQVLQEILQQTYQPSLVGKQLLGFGGETDIRRAGTIVVIQRPGLYGSFLHSEPASSSITGLKCELFRGHKDYEVPVGERYYVTSVNVASSTVLVGLISARSVPAHTGAGRLWTTLSFNFPDQVLATAEKETVFRAFDQWFLPEGRGVSAAPPSDCCSGCGSRRCCSRAGRCSFARFRSAASSFAGSCAGNFPRQHPIRACGG